LASTRAHNAQPEAAAAKSTHRESTPPLRSHTAFLAHNMRHITYYTYFAARNPKSNCHVTLKTRRLDIKLLKQAKNMHLLKTYPIEKHGFLFVYRKVV
jgi:hypothetical protein